MINRRPRQSTDPGHQADAAASQRLRLQSDKAPEALFIQNRGQLPIALSCGACLRRSNHSETLCREIPPWESRSTNSSRSVVIMTQLFMDEPLVGAASWIFSEMAGCRAFGLYMLRFAQD